MKYTSVSSVLWYHLYMFSNPPWIATLSSWNFEVFAMFSHVSCKNSRTGIVHQIVGSLDFEKDCCTDAGSCYWSSASVDWCRICECNVLPASLRAVASVAPIQILTGKSLCKSCWRAVWGRLRSHQPVGWSALLPVHASISVVTRSECHHLLEIQCLFQTYKHWWPSSSYKQ